MADGRLRSKGAAKRGAQRAAQRASGALGTAERCRFSSPAMVVPPWQGWGLLEQSRRRGWKDGGEGEPCSAAWVWGQPTAAATLLARCLAAGVFRQETLDSTCRKPQCFMKFSEMEKMANMEAEINEKKLKIEILQLEKETADIAHPFYLGQKCEILQDMNRHLEAVLKNKRALRKRLIKPRCQDSLPIEATFHKYVVELLTEAMTFIEKLESHLQTVRSIPEVPNTVKNMDTALAKTELLVMELEELTDQILKWRELQKEFSNYLKNKQQNKGQ